MAYKNTHTKKNRLKKKEMWMVKNDLGPDTGKNLNSLSNIPLFAKEVGNNSTS